jgi:hypothetical protein
MQTITNAMENNTKNPSQTTVTYTSENGNTYFQKMRFTNHLAISYNIGEGYAQKFLNGITIYGWDGAQVNVIARKDFKGANAIVYNAEKAKHEAAEILKDYLLKQAKNNGIDLDVKMASDFSIRLVEEAS